MLKYLLAVIATFAILPSQSLAHDKPAELVRVAVQNAQVSGANTTGFDAIRNVIDTEAIARFTLGRHGRGLSVDQMERFEAALTHQMELNYNRHLNEIGSARINVLDSKARSDRDVVVKTEISGIAEDPLQVRWRVLKRGETWRIIDVEVFGVWLAIEQRAQFAAILDRPGANIDTLIKELQAG